MNPYAHVPADDPLFGAVRIELDHEGGTLGVSGDGLPPVEIRRAPHTVPESHVPIGTRDPEHLTLLVDGGEETLRPSKGFLTRRSYRVEVVSGARECSYLLVPDSLGTSGCCGTSGCSASSHRAATGACRPTGRRRASPSVPGTRTTRPWGTGSPRHSAPVPNRCGSSL